MDLDDLRNLSDDESSSGRMSFDDIAADDDFEGMAIDEEGNAVAPRPSGPFMGMSARERMFLAIMLFGNVLVLGIGFLLATGRLG